MDKENIETEPAMTSRKPAADIALLQSIEIPNPCTESWDTMRGDEQVRHCGVCKKNVYNLSAMPQAQAAALVAETVDGDLCVRFYLRSDGTVMDSDCSTSTRVKFHRAMRTLPRMAAGAAGAAAVVAAAAHAAPGTPARPGQKPTVVEASIVKDQEPPQPVMMGTPLPPPVEAPFVGKMQVKHTAPIGRVQLKQSPSDEGKPRADPQPASQPPADPDKGDVLR